MEGWDSKAVWGVSGAKAVVQGNIFEISTGVYTDTNAISVIDWNDDNSGGTSVPNALLDSTTSSAQTATTITVPYSFTVDFVDTSTQQQALKDLITADAGWQSTFPGITPPRPGCLPYRAQCLGTWKCSDRRVEESKNHGRY